MFAQILSKTMQPALWVLNGFDNFLGRSIIHQSANSPSDHIQNLREKGSMVRSLMVNGWVVLGFNEVQELLRDERVSANLATNKFVNLVIRSATGNRPVPFLDHPSMQMVDPPDHTRLRKLTAAGFTFKYVQSLAPGIEQIIAELIANIDEPEFDVMKKLARPLPAIVIAEMLGVPREDRHLFEKWSARILGFTQVLNPGAINIASVADIEMRAYLAKLADKKRSNLKDDLLSELIVRENEQDHLTIDELYSACVLLLLAGHETTARLIGNCLFALLKNPSIMADVRANPDLLEQTIEESLRFDPPVMMFSRTIKESFLYKGNYLKKGKILLLSLIGANHDPAVNPDPGTFDIYRENRSHVSFGHGIHLCLGMSLARLEAKLVLKHILDRFENIELTDSVPGWEHTPFFRGLEYLNVKVS